MSKVIIDAPTESSPVTVDINEGFSEFQEEQRAARSAVVEEPLEDAPASERDIPAGDEPATRKQEPLTDEQKSAAKRANNEKRWDKLLRERDEARAELERLKTPKAEPAAPAPAASRPVPDDTDDPRPRQDFNPKTGKPYSDFDEYVDDRSSWNARQVIRTDQANREAAAVETQVIEQSTAFMDKIGEFASSHAGFIGTEDEPGPFEIVRDELEDGLPEVSKAIVEHDRPAEVIHYLGSHPEALDKILSHRGNPRRALIELGKLTAQFDESPATPLASTPQRRTPKPPAPVGGRGHAPSGEAALDAAAEANDFSAFQKTLRARERRR